MPDLVNVFFLNKLLSFLVRTPMPFQINISCLPALDIVINWLIVQPHKLKRAEKKVDWPDKSAAKFWPALKKKE